MPGLCFLKLGGSLITDKNTPHTPKLETIHRLAREISEARETDPELQIIFGHGSGSFGHVPAHIYGTRAGVHSQRDWEGFVKVWVEAKTLNQYVMEALTEVGLPAVSFPPSSAITARDGTVQLWSLFPLQQALLHGIIPVVYGDVIFDEIRGGTILSTEELFIYLAQFLKPKRILLAGLENGVWEDFPTRSQHISEITPASFPGVAARLGSSASVDVTGGMLSKVENMVKLVDTDNAGMVLIFSAVNPNTLREVLLENHSGTIIHK